MAYHKWNVESVENYERKVADLIAEYSACHSLCRIHIGLGNKKTQMVNEGTSAGVNGTCDASCIGDCREGCYAITHMDGVYVLSRRQHAENTIMRRINAKAYYEVFFAYAYGKKQHLRVNETGDFETAEDVTALMAVAKKYPSVRVIGYTKRANLLKEVAKINKLDNVVIHYSLACNALNADIALRFSVPVTRITLDVGKCNCPNQLAKLNGKKHSCRLCAEMGIGCFSDKDVTFLAH